MSAALAERAASADATIRREMPNAIAALLDAHPGIRAVAFNGTTAERLYDRHFPRRAGDRLSVAAVDQPGPCPARLCREAGALAGACARRSTPVTALSPVAGSPVIGRNSSEAGVEPGELGVEPLHDRGAVLAQFGGA